MSRYRIMASVLWTVALALVAWTLLQMPLEAIADTVSSLTTWQWLLFLLLNGSVLLFLTQRWRTLINMQRERVSLAEVFLIRQAGQCISFITPGPQFGGEPFQLYWLWKRSLPLHKGLLALSLDRFMELWINFAILLAATFYLFFTVVDTVGTMPWMRVVLMLLLPLTGLSVLWWALLRRPEWLARPLHRVVSRWSASPRLSQVFELGAGQWQAVQEEWRQAVQKQRPVLMQAFGMTLLSWVAVLAELYLLLSFVGVQPALSTFVMIFLTIRVAMLLPMPAGIGTIEAGILWTFQSLGLDVASAMGLIALMRLRDAGILLLGVLCLKRVQGAVTDTATPTSEDQAPQPGSQELIEPQALTASVDNPPSRSRFPTV